MSFNDNFAGTGTYIFGTTDSDILNVSGEVGVGGMGDDVYNISLVEKTVSIYVPAAGGSGTFKYQKWGTAIEHEDQGFDEIVITGTSAPLGSGYTYNNYDLSYAPNIEKFTLDIGSSFYLLGHQNSNEIHMNAGNDIVSGEGGDDFIYGYAGTDQLSGGSGNDLLFGGDGNDKLFGGTGNDRIYGDNNDDILNVSGGNDTIYGGAGSDVVFGEVGDDWISGGFGNDILIGGEGADTIYGDSGGDRIYGGLGNDIIYAGSAGDLVRAGDGDDIIDGGTGNDHLFGGTGSDTFVFDENSETDTIHDFEDGSDMIDISSLLTSLGYSGSSAVADGYINFVDNGGNVEIYADSTGTGQFDTHFATLNGVNSSVLSDADFIMA